MVMVYSLRVGTAPSLHESRRIPSFRRFHRGDRRLQGTATPRRRAQGPFIIADRVRIQASVFADIVVAIPLVDVAVTAVV